MLLYSVSKLREELGFDDMTDITNAFTLALDAAETLIGSTLRTTFDRKTVTDTFYVNEPSFKKGGLNRTEFLLSTGFVSGTPNVVSNDASMTSVFTFDSEKGIGRDWTTNYASQIVTITYECGFEAELVGSPPQSNGSYKLDQVPTWLQQAAKIKTMLLVAKLPALTEAGINLETGLLEQQYASLINSHIRYAPSALLPL